MLPESKRETHPDSGTDSINSPQRPPIRTSIINQHHQQAITHPYHRHGAQHAIDAYTRPPPSLTTIPHDPIGIPILLWQRRFCRFQQPPQTGEEQEDGDPTECEQFVCGKKAEPALKLVEDEELACDCPEAVHGKGGADCGSLYG